METFDKITPTSWKLNCDLANSYYTFLEDQLVENNDTLLVTYARINLLLPCKQDCQFDRILSVPSNFTQNKVQFAINALGLLSSDITCKSSTIGSLVVTPKTANDLIANLSIE